jgi:hypothetical protein
MLKPSTAAAIGVFFITSMVELLKARKLRLLFISIVKDL